MVQAANNNVHQPNMAAAAIPNDAATAITAAIAAASHWNDQGAVYFAKGKWSLALASFRRSIDVIASHVAAVGPEDPPLLPAVPPVQHTTPATTILGVAALHLSPRQKVILESHNNHNHANSVALEEVDDDSSSPLLFMHPLVFDVPHEDEASMSSPSQLEQWNFIYCAVVIFNMALVSHKQGETTTGGNENQRHRSKALQLYDACIELLVRAGGARAAAAGAAGGGPGAQEFSAVMVAVHNNKSIIYYEDDRFDELEQEQTCLARAVGWAHLTPTTKNFLHYGTEFEAILLNLLLLKKPMVANAA